VAKGFIKLLTGIMLLGLRIAPGQTYESNWNSLDKRPIPAWFTDAKFGIFIHWGVYSVPAFAPVGIPKEQPYAEWYWHSMMAGKEKSDPNVKGTWEFHKRVYGADFPYPDFANQFKAELFNPTSWADLFAKSGARYVVLTSKHHDGFALWPSAEASRDFARPWNSVEAGPHRDLVGDLTAAVRARGLKMGLYFSLYEWYNPLWLTNREEYVAKHMIPQFKDVVTRYQPSLIFADGEWEQPSAQWKSTDLLAWLYNLPGLRDEVVVNDRWGSETRHLHGGYWTTEYTSGMAAAGHPWEENRGMGFSYGYNRAETLSQYHSSRELILMLADTVSRGGNFLLDIGPEADGMIPVVMEQRLLEIGDWLKINGEAIYGTRALDHGRLYGKGKLAEPTFNVMFHGAYDVLQLVDNPGDGKAPLDGFLTTKDDATYAILTHWTTEPVVLPRPPGQSIRSVTLLGSGNAISFRETATNVIVQLPEVPATLRNQPAWTLKLKP
jgi:alpha-L-fucosidase